MEIMTISPTISPMRTFNSSDSGLTNSVENTIKTNASIEKTSEYLEKRQTNPKNDRSSLEEKNILKKSTEEFNQLSEKLNLDVKFAYNDKLDQVYLNVIDKHTGKVIRKLPSEAAMKISESMKDLVGTLFDKKG